jgi:membrane protein DedA with SNARE-associated domain
MTSFLVSHAIYAIIVFGVLEAMCIPISSELTFLLGGAIASGAVTGAHQHPSLALVIILGTLAELAGSYISYAVGRVGGRPLVHRWGRYVLITEADVARAERFLVGRGVWAVPVARMLPFVRAFASIVAGIVEIPPLRFGVLSLIGTFVYVVVLSSIGYSLGSEWSKINHGLTVVTYVLAAVVVVAIIGFVFYRLREFRKESAAAARTYVTLGSLPWVTARARRARRQRGRAGRGPGRAAGRRARQGPRRRLPRRPLPAARPPR